MNRPSDDMARLVTERRFALYSEAAPVIIDIEEGLRAGDIKALERLGELDRILRSSLAFLTPAVSDALSRLRESTKDALVGGHFDEVETVQNLSDLHLALGQLLHDHGLHEMTKILRLPTAHPAMSGLDLAEEPPPDSLPEKPGMPVPKAKVPGKPGERPPSARTKTTMIEAPPPNEIKAWKHHKKAQEFYEEENYRKAVKQYQKALRLFPDQPAFHNDLALALRKADRLDESISEYRLAIELAGRFPKKRGEEWYNAFFNLGNALHALADEALARKDIEAALEAHRESITSFIEFLNYAAGSPNAAYAQKMVRTNQADIQELERWMRIITGGKGPKIDFKSIKKKLSEGRAKAESEKAKPEAKEDKPPTRDAASAVLEGPEEEAGAIPTAEPAGEPEDEPEVQIGDTDSARLKTVSPEEKPVSAEDRESGEAPGDGDSK